jgi:hypothetical protein
MHVRIEIEAFPKSAQGTPLPYMMCETTPAGAFDMGSILGFKEIAPGKLNISLAYGTVVCQVLKRAGETSFFHRLCFRRGQQAFIHIFQSPTGVSRASYIMMYCSADTDDATTPHKIPSNPSVENPVGSYQYALVRSRR